MFGIRADVLPHFLCSMDFRGRYSPRGWQGAYFLGRTMARLTASRLIPGTRTRSTSCDVGGDAPLKRCSLGWLHAGGEGLAAVIVYNIRLGLLVRRP